MDTEHWNMWLDDLATTEAPQCRGRLSAPTHGGRVGYCCLGRGEVVRGGTREGASTIGKSLATREFMDWLGLDLSAHDERHQHDTPADCLHGFDIVADTEGYPTVNPRSAAGMNDSGLTFKQIADVFRYFGPGSVA